MGGGCGRAELTSLFLECVVAPGFTAEARDLLAAKANLRLLELAPAAIDAAGHNHVRSILGGVLVQDLDDQPIDPTGPLPPSALQRIRNALTCNSPGNWCAMCVPIAIVVAKGGQSLGVGAGQMNRVGGPPGSRGGWRSGQRGCAGQ